SELMGYNLSERCNLRDSGVNIYKAVATSSIKRKSARFTLRRWPKFLWRFPRNRKDWWTASSGPTSSLTWVYNVKGDIGTACVFPLVQLILYCLLLCWGKCGINHYVHGSALLPSSRFALSGWRFARNVRAYMRYEKWN